MLQAGTDLFSLHRPNQVRGFEAATKATPPSRGIEVGSLQNRRNFRHSKAEPRDASTFKQSHQVIDMAQVDELVSCLWLRINLPV